MLRIDTLNSAPKRLCRREAGNETVYLVEHGQGFLRLSQKNQGSGQVITCFVALWEENDDLPQAIDDVFHRGASDLLGAQIRAYVRAPKVLSQPAGTEKRFATKEFDGRRYGGLLRPWSQNQRGRGAAHQPLLPVGVYGS